MLDRRVVASACDVSSGLLVCNWMFSFNMRVANEKQQPSHCVAWLKSQEEYFFTGCWGKRVVINCDSGRVRILVPPFGWEFI